jgi:hypothetical protein
MAVENEVKCIIKFGLCISRFFFKEGKLNPGARFISSLSSSLIGYIKEQSLPQI